MIYVFVIYVYRILYQIIFGIKLLILIKIEISNGNSTAHYAKFSHDYSQKL